MVCEKIAILFARHAMHGADASLGQGKKQKEIVNQSINLPALTVK